MSEKQWIRHCKLLIGGNGDGLDISGLRVVFKVQKTDAETPNSAEIRVYNLAPDTAKKIKKEFQRVILQAGYISNYGVIFDGNIKQCVIGRENGTDTFLDIYAGDGDDAYNFAVVNKTLKAGATPADQVDACAGAMAEKGTSKGYTGGLQGGKALPRGKVMYGLARDYMRQQAATTGTTWSVQDGKLQMIPRTELLPGQAVLLTSKTGLIGTPEQDEGGIRAECLLNPLLKIGGKVIIREADIQEAKLPDTEGDTGANAPAKIAVDGVYRLLSVEHAGDTHGQEWYSRLVCLDVDETAPKDKAVKNG